MKPKGVNMGQLARGLMGVTLFLFLWLQARSQAEFILTYDTTNPGVTDGNSLRFPAVNGLYDVDVNNDGSYELLDQTGPIDIDVTFHGYGAGTIQIAVRNAISGTGSFETLRFADGNDDTKLIIPLPL